MRLYHWYSHFLHTLSQLNSELCWVYPVLLYFQDLNRPLLRAFILQDPNWRARESAILALGAVAEGCEQGLLPYLGGMVAMMLPKLADARPMVRVITCWALTRYSRWLLEGEGSQEWIKGGGGLQWSHSHVQETSPGHV